MKREKGREDELEEEEAEEGERESLALVVEEEEVGSNGKSELGGRLVRSALGVRWER